jgi:hypothetical protein
VGNTTGRRRRQINGAQNASGRHRPNVVGTARRAALCVGSELIYPLISRSDS